jgi:hypothetical protein
MVGQAFVGCAEGRKLYRQRVVELYKKVFATKNWPARVGAVAKKLCAAVEPVDGDLSRHLAGEAAELRQIVAERVKSIGRQVEELGTPFEFNAKGIAILPAGWHFDGDNATHDERDVDGRKCLHLHATGRQLRRGESPWNWRTAATVLKHACAHVALWPRRITPAKVPAFAFPAAHGMDAMP